MQRLFSLAGLVSLVVAFGVGSLAAAQTFTNGTGSAVTGTKITFSHMVWVTAWDKAVFPTQSPVGVQSEITFSGGTLPALATFSVTWGEEYASVTGYTWLTGPGTAAGSPTASATSGPLTYDQIMAQIAHYPGPDEPLYKPQTGEQVWLTDLQGHQDIYDNDSIKINYAPGFDKSQITKIEVYRNGVLMDFLPAKFDVLTNDQMKTFDGNPLEHSPASAHTDHAIVGYQYKVLVYGASSALLAVVLTQIQNPVGFSGEYLMANISHNWWNALLAGHFYGSPPEGFFRNVREMGFKGVQVEVHMFMDDMSSNEVFPIYDYGSSRLPDWQRTATDAEIVAILGYIRDAGLEAELAIQIWTTLDCKNSNPSVNIDRGNIYPRSVATWFDNYASICEHYARLAEANHVECFCPIVELETMEQFTDQVTRLLERVHSVFSGELAVAEGTNKMAFGWFPKGGHLGEFWGYDSMLIGMNSWVEELETQKDQRFSVILERFANFWRPFVDEYRRLYPGHEIVFEENGFYNYDGASLGYRHEETNPVRDDQEVSDYWAAVFAALRVLGMDGISVWCIDIRDPNVRTGNATLNQPPLLYTITSFIQ